MLPLKIKNDIIEIRNLFNNYDYMKKNKEELFLIKTSIINIISSLDTYKDEAMVKFAFKYHQHMKDEKGILSSNYVIDTGQFYENCANVKFRFKKFLNKIKKRIDTLEIGEIEFSEEQKDDFYDQALHYIESNEIELLEQLLNENIIDVNYVPELDEDDEFEVPLIIIACQYNNLNIVKMLHNNNANLNVNIDNDFEDDVSPLLAAIISSTENDVELITYLLDNGASPNFLGGLQRLPLNEVISNSDLYEKMIVNYGADVNFVYNGGSPLIYACEAVRFDAIRILLANGADVNLRNNEDDSALHYLIREFDFEDDINEIKIIIDLFILKNFNFNFQNNLGDTILHDLTFENSDINIIKYLLDKNITYNTNLCNWGGNTPLHYLLSEYKQKDWKDIIEIINWFINHNFVINCVNLLGETILHKSFEKLLNINITKHLLDCNININAKNAVGDTSLHYLINHFQNKDEAVIKQVIELFAKYNFDFNLQNDFGNTVLHSAIKMEVDITIIKCLLKNNININIINQDRKTILQVAKECKNQEIFRIINNYQFSNLSNIDEPSTSTRGQKRKHDSDNEDDEKCYRKK